MIAILVEFAQAGAATSVQTYVNRRVPLDVQGNNVRRAGVFDQRHRFRRHARRRCAGDRLRHEGNLPARPPLLAATLIWLIRLSSAPR